MTGLRLVLIAAGLLVGTVASAADAEEWLQVDRNGRGDALFVDLKSIRHQSGKVYFTERMDFGEPRRFSDGTLVKSIWSSYALDCARKMRATLKLRGVTPTGLAIGMRNPLEGELFKANDTNPRSPDAITLKFVCEFRR